MKLIVIDCGHGGHDGGAQGPLGTKEKDIVLKVGLKMRLRLQNVPGLKVLMTRSADNFVKLSNRAEIANESNAYLFLSLHCNSAKNPASGFEAFTSHGHTESDVAVTYFLNSYQKKFQWRTNRGAKEASFFVLTQTSMPAVLFELEFIHTPAGEKFLTDDRNQDDMADALCDGVLDYLGLEKLPENPPIEDLQELELVRNAIDTLRELERRMLL